MKAECTHYMGICDRLVCPREEEKREATRAEIEAELQREQDVNAVALGRAAGMPRDRALAACRAIVKVENKRAQDRRQARAAARERALRGERR
jgi:hypothetical protein